MKPICCGQEMGDTEIVLCPGASQGPAGFHLLRLQASKSLLSPPQELLHVLLVDSIIVLSYDKQKIRERITNNNKKECYRTVGWLWRRYED